MEGFCSSLKQTCPLYMYMNLDSIGESFVEIHSSSCDPLLAYLQPVFCWFTAKWVQHILLPSFSLFCNYSWQVFKLKHSVINSFHIAIFPLLLSLSSYYATPQPAWGIYYKAQVKAFTAFSSLQWWRFFSNHCILLPSSHVIMIISLSILWCAAFTNF